MELYINNHWTKLYENAYVAEAIAWSETGNHATIYTLGITAEEAETKLMGALRELQLVPEAPTNGECISGNRNSGGEEIATD
jgi:hypothetical protein